MNNIQDKVQMKNQYTDNLNNMLFLFFSRLIKKSSHNIKSRDFQIELFEIPKWSVKKQLKEYNKFIVYINSKFRISEDDLIKIFEVIIELNINVLNKFFIKETDFIMPKLQDLFYKLYKKIGKYYYENPIEPNNNINQINNIIKYTMDKFIPLKDILNYKNIGIESYNFNSYNKSESETEITDNINKLRNLTKNKQDDLIYISSDEFDNEYYNSNIDIKQKQNEEQQIKIPKLKKN